MFSTVTNFSATGAVAVAAFNTSDSVASFCVSVEGLTHLSSFVPASTSAPVALAACTRASTAAIISCSVTVAPNSFSANSASALRILEALALNISHICDSVLPHSHFSATSAALTLDGAMSLPATLERHQSLDAPVPVVTIALSAY